MDSSIATKAIKATKEEVIHHLLHRDRVGLFRLYRLLRTTRRRTMGYLDKALETMQQQRGRIVNHDLLDATLREIGKEYRPGLIRWIRHDSGQWSKFLALEGAINQTTLAGDDPGLKAALRAYKDFFREMLEQYEMSSTLPLFGKGTR